MYSPSPFTEVAAVRTWDTWFRWRESGELRDRTIEATWWRTARAVAAVEGVLAESWTRRFYDALARWQLLPDERLLTGAGTGAPLHLDGVLRASINARAFVRPLGAGIDLPGVAETASLAVRLLGDSLRMPEMTEPPSAIRVGLIGVADAFQALGLEYDSDAAREVASELAGALSRGVRMGAQECSAAGGVLTAIVPQPRLASLANATSDALDPLPSRDGGAGVDAAAQLRLRQEMQRWIDDAIDYPLAPARQPRQAAL